MAHVPSCTSWHRNRKIYLTRFVLAHGRVQGSLLCAMVYKARCGIRKIKRESLSNSIEWFKIDKTSSSKIDSLPSMCICTVGILTCASYH